MYLDPSCHIELVSPVKMYCKGQEMVGVPGSSQARLPSGSHNPRLQPVTQEDLLPKSRVSGSVSLMDWK